MDLKKNGLYKWERTHGVSLGSFVGDLASLSELGHLTTEKFRPPLYLGPILVSRKGGNMIFHTGRACPLAFYADSNLRSLHHEQRQYPRPKLAYHRSL